MSPCVGKSFADAIKLKILMWGNYPGFSGWTLNAITCIFRGRRLWFRGVGADFIHKHMRKDVKMEQREI